MIRTYTDAESLRKQAEALDHLATNCAAAPHLVSMTQIHDALQQAAGTIRFLLDALRTPQP